MSLGTMLLKTEEEPINLPQEEIKLPLSNEKLLALQAEDKFCSDISSKLQRGQLQNKNPYYKENEILKDMLRMENKGLR